MSKLNSKTLTIAAVVLMVLALLFMATPLLRVAGVANRTGFTRPANGQFPSGGQNGFPNQSGGLQGQGFSGPTGTIVYTIAMLVSLAAAIGMFITKRWGQVLGIVMAVIYLILALVSFLPMLLMSFMGGLNGLSLGLSILHLVLAIAVIVLALIPAKKVLVPSTPATPPAAIA